MGVREVQVTGDEPVTVEEAGFNVKAPTAGTSAEPVYVEAELLARLIKAARRACENYTEVSLVRKTLEASFDGFDGGSGALALERGPVRSIEWVKYADCDGILQTLPRSSYRIVGSYSALQAIQPVYGTIWPTARADRDSVIVRYSAGYPSDDTPQQTAPDEALQAIHLLVAHFYINREAVNVGNIVTDLPMGVRFLLGPNRGGLGV